MMLKQYFSSMIRILSLLISLPSNLCRTDQVGGSVTATGEGCEGIWSTFVFCDSGTYVDGYRQRVVNDLSADPTALNSIEMSCSDYKGNKAHTIKSDDGCWGQWYNYAYCPSQEKYRNFLTGYKILEGPVETGAHGMKGFCLSEENFEAEGTYTNEPGIWGDWGICPKETAICGFQTRMEDEQESLAGEDNSALNHIRIICCRLCDFSGGQYPNGNSCGLCHYSCKTCSGGGANQCTSCFFTSNYAHTLTSSTCQPGSCN
jgi:hypothetical protein